MVGFVFEREIVEKLLFVRKMTDKIPIQLDSNIMNVLIEAYQLKESGLRNAHFISFM